MTMMNFLTKEQVKRAAKRGPKTAKKCSIEHWRQLSTATPAELEAMANVWGAKLLGVDFCALCGRYLGKKGCLKCPLADKYGVCNLFNSDNAWEAAVSAFDDWFFLWRTWDTPRQQLWERWKRASKRMLKQLESLD